LAGWASASWQQQHTSINRKREGKREMPENLGWKVHTPGLFKLIIEDPHGWAFQIPLNIMLDLLRKVAQRATELNDPELNKLMIRLSLYSISNPEDPEYNPELVNQLLEGKP
jgi:hypothetical protein